MMMMMLFFLLLSSFLLPLLRKFMLSSRFIWFKGYNNTYLYEHALGIAYTLERNNLDVHGFGQMLNHVDIIVVEGNS
jgi:hypothetical protein